MPENNRIKKEYIPQFSHALLHAHQLLGYFLASERIAEMAAEEGFAFLGLMQQLHEKAEVRQLLVNIATNIRIGRDYQKIHYAVNVDLSKAQVGKLIEAGKQKPLALLEACNKIIHAIKFVFETGETRAVKNSYTDLKGGKIRLPYLKPIVHLSGKRWNKSLGIDVSWEATIDIETFAKHAVVACVGYMWQFKENK